MKPTTRDNDTHANSDDISMSDCQGGGDGGGPTARGAGANGRPSPWGVTALELAYHEGFHDGDGNLFTGPEVGWPESDVYNRHFGQQTPPPERVEDSDPEWRVSQDCPLCASLPHAEGSDQRRCAFRTGVFDHNNWCCATMSALAELADRADAWRGNDRDERVAVLPIPDCDEDLGEFLVLQQYKRRGTVQGAVVFHGKGYAPLTLDVARKLILLMRRPRRPQPVILDDEPALPDGMAAVVAKLERLEQAGDDTPSLPDKLTFGVPFEAIAPLVADVERLVRMQRLRDGGADTDCDAKPVRGPNGGQVESQHGPCDSGGMSVREFLESTHAGREMGLSAEKLEFVRARLEAGEAKYGQPLRMDWPRAAEARDEEIADAIAYSVAMRDTETSQALALLWAGETPRSRMPFAEGLAAVGELLGEDYDPAAHLQAVQGEHQPGWWREALGELEHASIQAALGEHGPALDVACAFVVRALTAGKARPGDLKPHGDALQALFEAVDDWDPDARVCEGCPNLATTSDADGIPLCPECVALQVEHEAREGGEVSQ